MVVKARETIRTVRWNSWGRSSVPDARLCRAIDRFLLSLRFTMATENEVFLTIETQMVGEEISVKRLK